MESEVSLQFSQVHATGPHPEPDEFTHHPTILFLSDPF
jgi:hypothetical protein